MCYGLFFHEIIPIARGPAPERRSFARELAASVLEVQQRSRPLNISAVHPVSPISHIPPLLHDPLRFTSSQPAQKIGELMGNCRELCT